jgi:hypothetical protein
MRAQEFIVERKGTIGKRRQNATRGLNLMRDGERINTAYKVNRVMMAAAATDGKITPNTDEESWVGNWALAAPYTQEEQEILKKAYKAVNADYHDLNRGDLDSEEVPSTNRISPIKPFNGYR